MVKSRTKDGEFERENGELVQSSMAIGFLPNDTTTSTDDGFSTYTAPAAVTLIPGMNSDSMKFFELSVPSNSPVSVYITDRNGVATPGNVKQGREVEKGQSVSYPFRGQSPAEYPYVWSVGGTGVYTITRGY